MSVVQSLPLMGTTIAAKMLAAQLAGEASIEVDTDELADILYLFKRGDETSSQIVTATHPKWAGGKKNIVVSRLAPPDSIVKFSRYNCSLGIWANHIANKAERAGIEGVEYKPLPPNGKNYVGDSPLMVSDDGVTHYVSIMPIGFWKEVCYKIGDELLPDLADQEYQWKGVGRAERETGVKGPTILTPKLSNIKYFAPWGRGANGQFQPIRFAFWQK